MARQRRPQPGHLLDAWAGANALFRKLQFGPTAADLDPGAGRGGARGLADQVETLGKARHPRLKRGQEKEYVLRRAKELAEFGRFEGWQGIEFQLRLFDGLLGFG